MTSIRVMATCKMVLAETRLPPGDRGVDACLIAVPVTWTALAAPMLGAGLAHVFTCLGLAAAGGLGAGFARIILLARTTLLHSRSDAGEPA